MVITGFCTIFLNCCFVFLFLIALTRLSDSCAINLPSTFSQFWHLASVSTLFSSLLFSISPPRAPLSCLLSSWAFSSRLCSFALASSGSLRSLRSDVQGLNAMLEMIITLCSCSSVFCIFTILSNTLLILFLSLCLAHSSSLCSSHCSILSNRRPRAKGMLKPCWWKPGRGKTARDSKMQ